MFEKLDTLLRRRRSFPGRLRAERISQYDLEGRPVTRALLLHTATVVDKAVSELGQLVGKARPVITPKTLQGEVDSAICTTTIQILLDAMDANGQKLPLPGDEISPRMIMIICYGFVVVTGFVKLLETENIKFDFAGACLSLVATLFLLHSTDDKKSVYRRASECFQDLTKSTHENAVKFRTNVTNLIYIYINNLVPGFDFAEMDRLPTLFSSMLKSFLEAVE